ncbi:branched-chain amino acid ABC transporter substrate-binding protein [Caenimonas sedimenti]|uniref:Branched-chain amino acid ABC transporter substrate-binding protein n=1 Tax=Caenimonas sedimenti TaxID=2596921 RepID=A0A562ZLR0_9BURK|nr:branched-chain amino acid ABC transporter substrate-binding protein [Caenimonas sedimenti]TWO69512.1 branched-chain amino acid ABC transporter substrate-binding protein [Caenimonas sedimenti]
MQKPNRRLAATSILAFGVIATSLLTACDSTPSVIKIGVAQPLSGPLAALGQDMHNGVKLAVDELNKSGFKVKGKPVTLEVVVVDDRANADTGKQVAQQLVDAGIVAVIGHLNSGVSIAAAPIYADKNIAQLAISTNPKYTDLGHATTFRLVGNDTLQAKAIGSYASQLSAKTFAVVDDGTPYGKGLADGAAAQLKTASKNIVLRQSFDDKTTAFDELAGKLKEANVDAIISTLNDFQVVAMLEALKKIGHTNLAVLGGDTLKTTTGLKAAGLAQAVYATSPILEAREFPAGAKFLAAYREAFKLDPAYGGHYSYDAMHVLAGAIKRGESAKPENIVKALRAIDGYAPVTGSMKFDAKGEQRYGVISVYAVRNGLWEAQMRSDNW